MLATPSRLSVPIASRGDGNLFGKTGGPSCLASECPLRDMSSSTPFPFRRNIGQCFGETLETPDPFIRLCVSAPRALSSGRKVGPGRWRMVASPPRPVTLPLQQGSGARAGPKNARQWTASAWAAYSRPPESQVPPSPSNPPKGIAPRGSRPLAAGRARPAAGAGGGVGPVQPDAHWVPFAGGSRRRPLGRSPSRLVIWFPRASEDAGTHSFHSLRSVNERGEGWGGRARGGPGGLPPPPAPPAEPRHKCCDSHGPAGSAAGGPGIRGPGDGADAEGFVDTVTSALPL